MNFMEKFEMDATPNTRESQRSLKFGGHVIKTTTRNGMVWLSGTEIGRALEYAAPDKAIKQLYDARSDEFTAAMSKVMRVATAGGRQAVRFFNLRGAHLLAMFARTPVAKQFRAWVLDLIDREFASGKATPPKHYSFPLQSCKPVPRGDCFDHQAQFDLTTLTDPRNPKPELELIRQLERDGHDVTGARVRILAMHQQLTYMASSRKRMGVWASRIMQVCEELKCYQDDKGLGVLFSREPKGIETICFDAQLPNWKVA